MEKQIEDEVVFGYQTIVYCNQHLRPHFTGWCSVSPRNKIKLDAKTLEQAYVECRSKGYKLFEDKQ